MKIFTEDTYFGNPEKYWNIVEISKKIVRNMHNWSHQQSTEKEMIKIPTNIVRALELVNNEKELKATTSSLALTIYKSYITLLWHGKYLNQ